MQTEIIWIISFDGLAVSPIKSAGGIRKACAALAKASLVSKERLDTSLPLLPELLDISL